MREAADAHTYRYVVARDTDYYGHARCIRCGRKADDVHEIIPRSAFGKHNRDILFQIKNRCCLCRKCHEQAATDQRRGELLNILATLHNYTYTGAAKCLLEEYKENQL